MSRFALAALLVSFAVQSPSPAQTPGNVPPGNASPEAPSPAPTAADPAVVTFGTDFGLLLVAVKPDKAADYEAVIVALQAALAAAADEETRRVAAGWRVYKAAEVDAKSNALYVHVLRPPVPAADYRPSLWLDRLLDGAPADLLAKYRDAFAAPPSKLALVEFADMSVAPVPPAGNTSPEAPTAPPKPGNGSPGGPGPR